MDRGTLWLQRDAFAACRQGFLVSAQMQQRGSQVGMRHRVGSVQGDGPSRDRRGVVPRLLLQQRRTEIGVDDGTVRLQRNAGTIRCNGFVDPPITFRCTSVSGRRVKVRYMTQVKARPPTFALFGNQLKHLPEDYQRYLTNGLREAFELKGTPIRFLMRGGKNPFADK